MFLALQRALLALCLINCTSCTSSSSCRQWEFQEITTKYPRFNGGKLTLGPNSDYSHLELEVVRNSSGMRFYINLLFLEASPYKENPLFTQVTIEFKDRDPWVVYAYLLEGSQRLLLSKEAAETLIDFLLNEQEFTIKIGRNQILAISTEFGKGYDSLMKVPIEELCNK